MFSQTALTLTTLLLLTTTSALNLNVLPRQAACPNVHIFGARETTVSPGYGTAGVVVNLVLNSNPGSTAEAIVYPACGGQASCGGQSYAQSALAGTAAVASAVNAYNARCPNTKLVLVGYSQGGQIMDNAVCGGGDTNIGLTNTAVPINAAALNMIKATIEMGSPRFRAGFTYNVGTCTAQGFAPRPAGFVCPSASKLKSYCDAADPYCCTGSDQATHQGYGTKYGQQALAFINSQLAAGGTNPTTVATTTAVRTTTAQGTNPTTTAASGGSGVAQKWGQCGGQGWNGPTVCVAGTTCKANGIWYSQCL